MTSVKPLSSRAGMDMCNGPMAGKLILFALPLMLSRIVQLLFNAADIVVVSKFCGDSSLAAVGSTTSIINLMLNVFFGLSTATNILCARSLGKKKYDDVEKIVHTSILLSAIAGILVAILGITISRPALILMKSPDNVIDLSTLYFRIYCLGMPASVVYNFGSALLNSKGDTKKPLYIITVSGIINFALNLFFVTVCGMSVDGVAAATVISQYVSAFCVIYSLMKDEGVIRLDIKKLSIHKKQLLDIIKIGFPAGCQGLVFSLSNVIVQSSVNIFGKDLMAGYAAANSIQGFLYSAMNAFYQANLTFTSQNVGAGKWDRVRRSLLLNISYVTVIGISLGSITFAFSKHLLGIYISEPSVIEHGINCARFLWLPVFLCGLMETSMGGIRGMGHTTLPMIVSMLGACGIRVLWIATVFQMHPTTHVLFMAYPLSWGMTAIAHITCYIIIYKKEKKAALTKAAANSTQ